MKRIANWTDEEDKLLLKLYDQVDCFQKWKFISENFKKIGFLKNQIQCRQRFVNKLNPELRQDKLRPEQLKLLFQYYDQYGPLWSVFQSLIPGRNQNLLKNKFYSTLRSLVRIIIASCEKNCHEKKNISSTSLSSKILVEIYEGKKNFRKFKGVFRSFLNRLNFQLDLEHVKSIDNQLALEILEKIKQEVEKTKSPKKKVSNSKSLGQIRQTKNSPSVITQQQKIHSPINVTQQTKQKITQNRVENTFVVSPPSIQVQSYQPYPSYFNFYVPQLKNSLNFFVPFWNYAICNQNCKQQQSS